MSRFCTFAGSQPNCPITINLDAIAYFFESMHGQAVIVFAGGAMLEVPLSALNLERLLQGEAADWKG